MFEKKKLLINCDVCDTRKMKEEDYTQYEQIIINSDVVIVNEASKSMFNRLPMVLNNDKMLEVPNDLELKFKTVDSGYEIAADTVVDDNTFLVVNGPLQIQTGAEEVLDRYLEIVANGPVRCPKSVAALLSKITVNGPIITYPDGSVVLKKTFEIDKYFPLRAKDGAKYYVEKQVIVRDKGVDIQKMVQKGVTFVTKQLVVPECKIEECIPMFDEQVEFEVIPDDMGIVLGKTTLNEELLLKYGKQLYISGNLELNNDSIEICEQVERLIVRGKVTLKSEQLEAFRKIDAEYDEIEIIKGRQLMNQVSIKIDQKLLDHSPDGISVANAANVKIAEEVAIEDILDKLQIKNCANVICSEEQKSAVTAISENIANIKVNGEKQEKEDSGSSFGGILKGMLDTKLINADTHIM